MSKKISKWTDENYYQITGWMLNRLELKGNDLLVFAIINGFSQDNESCYHGSLKYLQDAIGSSRSTVISVLKRLEDRGLIIKTSTTRNGMVLNSYTRNGRVVQILNGGGTDSERGGGTDSVPNNKPLDNKEYNKGKAKPVLPPISDNSKSNSIKDQDLKEKNVSPKKEKIKKWNRKDFTEFMESKGGDPQLISDWCDVRTKKRATFTLTVANSFIREASKANVSLDKALEMCITRNWTGFESSWYNNAIKDNRGFNQAPKPKMNTNRGDHIPWSGAKK